MVHSTHSVLTVPTPCFAFHTSTPPLSSSPSLSFCLSVQAPLVGVFVVHQQRGLRDAKAKKIHCLPHASSTHLPPNQLTTRASASSHSYIFFSVLNKAAQATFKLWFLSTMQARRTRFLTTHFSLNADNRDPFASAKWIWFVAGVSWCETDCTTKLIM